MLPFILQCFQIVYRKVRKQVDIQLYVDELNYRAWNFITSFIDHAILGQKATENQWRVMVLEEFLHTALLYQATNTRNINVLPTILGSH